MGSRTYITTDDIRMFVLDRDLADNPLTLDLAFLDDEINAAMYRAAREFNSIMPHSIMVEGQRLPNDTNIFLHATAEQLYRSELSKLRRADFDYTAGGVTTNLVAKRVAHLREMILEERAAWEPRAKDIKIQRNMSTAYGEW